MQKYIFCGDIMKDWDDIKVNKRKTDKIYFESPLIQSISDTIDFLRDESKGILEDLDSTEFKQKIDEIDMEEIGQKSVNHMTEMVDDLAEFKDDLLEYREIPDVLKESSRGFKFALNRDEEYVRRAKRRLMNEDYDNYERIIRLCDKAIDVNDINWEAYYIKGIALTNLTSYEEAIELFIKTLALKDNDNIRLHLAKAYRLNNEFENALDIYNSILVKGKNPFAALKGIAFTYYKWKKYDQASQFFRRANSIKPLDEMSKAVWDVCLEKI